MIAADLDCIFYFKKTSVFWFTYAAWTENVSVVNTVHCKLCATVNTVHCKLCATVNTAHCKLCATVNTAHCKLCHGEHCTL